MKPLLLIASLLLATNCPAKALTSYLDVKNAIVKGDEIRLALNMAKCERGRSNLGNLASSHGIYPTSDVVMFKDGSIKSSLKQFTLQDPAMPGKAIYQYVVYTVKPNDRVKITEYLLDARSNASLGSEQSYTCKINDGARFFG